MKLITAITAILISLSLSAQEGGAEVKNKEHQGQASQSVLDTETVLDKKITALNEDLKKHTVLFRQKIKALPAKTVLVKGKAEGENCVAAEKQEDAANDCIKIEVFDFQDSEWGKSELNYGSRAKYMILFYEGGSSGTGDPLKEEPRAIKKIVFTAINRDFKHNQVHYVNIDDEAPAQENSGVANETGGAHDEKTTVYYENGFPTILIDKTKTEDVTEKGVGKYSMKNVENSKTNPIRNTFKKSFYVKNIDYFHKLFTLVADTNERYSLKRYKESNEYMKGTLKY
jgi:hypothetical protein